MTRLLDAGRVAQRLGVSAPHVRHLWDAGTLPCLTIPSITSHRKIRRIDEAALDAWIQANTGGKRDD